jgi:hypothetical protein
LIVVLDRLGRGWRRLLDLDMRLLIVVALAIVTALLIVMVLLIVTALLIGLAPLIVMALPIGLALLIVMALMTLRLAVVALMLLVRLLAVAVGHVGIVRRLLMLRPWLALEALALGIHHPEIMFRVLKKIFRSDAIAGRLRLARQRQIALEHLIGVAANFDVGTVAVEGLRPVRRARSPVLVVMIRIAAAIAAARSLLWSHVTCLVAVGPIGSSSGRRLGTHPLVLRSDPLCGASKPVNASRARPASS